MGYYLFLRPAGLLTVLYKLSEMTNKYQSFVVALLLTCMHFPAAAQLSPLVIGDIPPEDSIMIYYDVAIDNPLPAGTMHISNQGTVSGSNFMAIVTDDPSVAGETDMTSISVLSSPLPVTLVQFSGMLLGEHAKLSWVTVQEINSDKYIVEHSTDGLNFSPVGTVPAKGNSATPEYYSFLHTQPPPGSNYYRLRQVDLDGRVTIYGTVTVRIPAGAWQVFPNPVVNKQVVIRFGSMPRGKYQVSLVNTAGQVVFRAETVYRVEGELIRLTLPRSIVPGLYYLRVNGSGSRQEKVLLVDN